MRIATHNIQWKCNKAIQFPEWMTTEFWYYTILNLRLTTSICWVHIFSIAFKLQWLHHFILWPRAISWGLRQLWGVFAIWYRSSLLGHFSTIVLWKLCISAECVKDLCDGISFCMQIGKTAPETYHCGSFHIRIGLQKGLSSYIRFITMGWRCKRTPLWNAVIL